MKPRFRVTGKREPETLFDRGLEPAVNRPRVEGSTAVEPADSIRLTDGHEQDTHEGPDNDETPPVEMPDTHNDDTPVQRDEHALGQEDGPDVGSSGSDVEVESVPVAAPSAPYSGGRWEELPRPLGGHGDYGPDKGWRHHLRERVNSRAQVGAQKAQVESKLSRYLRRSRVRTKVSARDVFFAEMAFLTEQELSEPVVHDTGMSVRLEDRACLACGSTHKRVTWGVMEVTGVDAPLDRSHVVPKKDGKSAKEYNWAKLTEEQRASFQVAMKKEWQSFLDVGAVRVLPADEAKKVPSSRILPARFILTNKDDSGATLIAKARMVCGGHLDPDVALLRTDAPTADAIGVNLVLVLCASNKWVLQSGDVSTAFLSGVFDYRNLYLRPPKEGLDGVNPGELLEMQKGVYGLCNAPRLWWRRLRQVLTQLGFAEMHMLPCVFVYWARDSSGERKQLMGLLAVHVDDMVVAGSAEFEKVLVSLKGELSFGKWYVREFDFLGRHLRQREDFGIEISQPLYADKIPKVPVSRAQLAQEDLAVTEETRADLRRTAGAACWLSKCTRPDLSFEVSLLQQSLTEATYATVKQANLLVHRAQQHPYKILIPPVDLKDPMVVTISDASPEKMPRSGSQGGTQ